MVVIHNIYIFDRHCQCVFYTEWNRQNTLLGAEAELAPDLVRGNQVLTGERSSHEVQRPPMWPTPGGPRNTAMEEEAKLVYGIALSTRNLAAKLAGTQPPASPGFLSLATNTYRMHYYESPTGVKFILNTDVATANMQPVLEMIYRNIYVEYVVKNPLFRVDPNVSTPIDNDYFRAVLNNYIREISASPGVAAAA